MAAPIIRARRNFSAGETTREIVTLLDAAILEKANGFEIEDGVLRPQGVISNVTVTPLSGTTPTQTPFPFVDDDSLILLARDANEQMREMASGAWGSASKVIDVVAESVPIRLRHQVVYATKGPNPKLMAYEPGYGANARPLSLKSPVDYEPRARPTVTRSASGAVRLFNCDSPGPDPAETLWAAADGDYSVDNTGTDKTILTATSTAIADEQAMTKSLGDTGVGLTGKSFLLVDLMIQDHTQLYDQMGLFVNNAGLYPSGYELVLYSDKPCTVEITRFTIPRLPILGKVWRIAFNIGTRTDTVKGLSINTSSFWTAPATGSTYKLTVYSDSAYDNEWEHKGNFLMGGIVYNQSPLAAELAKLTTGGLVDLPDGQNLVTNGDLEDPTGWTLAGGATWKSILTHSGVKCVELDGAGENLSRTVAGLVAGQQYAIEHWYFVNKDAWKWATGTVATKWKISLTFNDPVPTVTDWGWYEDYKASGYKLKRETFTCPTGATSCTLKAESFTEAYYDNFRLDDFKIYSINQAQSGSALLIQSFDVDGGSRSPLSPKVQYCYCFAAKDLLGEDTYKLMISNPSDPDSDEPDEVIADPWRTYSVAFALPAGYIATAAVAAGGTGYTNGDILFIKDGQGGKVRTTVTAGVVQSVELLSGGSGYTAGTLATEGQNGTGCTVTVTVNQADDDYGVHLSYILLYRRIYDGVTETWSAWRYLAQATYAASITFSDVGQDYPLAMIGGIEVPAILEIANDYASSALHCCFSEDRVRAGCLDWDEEDDEWKRPVSLEIFSEGKPHAAPTTYTENINVITDGVELEVPTVTGSIIRGMLTRGDDWFVWLDTELFLVRGDNPEQGWRFIRLDSVGLGNARTLVDCRTGIVWHEGNDGEFYIWQGGLARPISKVQSDSGAVKLIDSSLIDWTAPHNACYWMNHYVLFCEYNSVNSIIKYNLLTGGWTVRSSAALNFVGICADAPTGDVYGVTTDGYCRKVFGSTTTEATAATTQTPTREVFTQYIAVADSGADYWVKGIVLEAIASADIELSYTVRAYSRKNPAAVSDTMDIHSADFRHVQGLNLKCNAVKIELTYVGTAAPNIFSIGILVGEMVAQL